MNIRDIVNPLEHDMEPDDELLDALQEYVDEAENGGDPTPPESAIPWMYDFALYAKIAATTEP